MTSAVVLIEGGEGGGPLLGRPANPLMNSDERFERVWRVGVWGVAEAAAIPTAHRSWPAGPRRYALRAPHRVWHLYPPNTDDRSYAPPESPFSFFFFFFFFFFNAQHRTCLVGLVRPPDACGTPTPWELLPRNHRVRWR